MNLCRHDAVSNPSLLFIDPIRKKHLARRGHPGDQSLIRGIAVWSALTRSPSEVTCEIPSTPFRSMFLRLARLVLVIQHTSQSRSFGTRKSCDLPWVWNCWPSFRKGFSRRRFIFCKKVSSCVSFPPGELLELVLHRHLSVPPVNGSSNFSMVCSTSLLE